MVPEDRVEGRTPAGPDRAAASPGGSAVKRAGVAGAGAIFGAVIIGAGLVMNAAAFVAPIDYGKLGDILYPGIFLLTFIANASVVVPIPYVPIVIRAADAAPSVLLVVISAAAGSTIGEFVSFFVGRAGRGVVRDSRVYRWLSGVVHRPVIAGLVLFALSAPLNPFFDVAGLAAGALGLSLRVFSAAVFAGRLVRFAFIAWVFSPIARL